MNATQAQIQLNDAIDSNVSDGAVSRDWREKLCKHFPVAAVDEIVKPFEEAIGALIFMKQQSLNITGKQDCVVDIISYAFPNHEFLSTPCPTDEDLSVVDRDAVVAFQESNSAEEMRTNIKKMSKKARHEFISSRIYELAHKQAVDKLMNACELLTARYVWYNEVSAKLAQQNEADVAELREKQSFVDQKLLGEKLKTEEEVLKERRRSYSEWFVQMKEQIEARANLIQAQDPLNGNREEIEFEAQRETFNSKDSHVIALLEDGNRARADVGIQIEAVEKIRAVVSYYESWYKLCDAVLKVRRQSMASDLESLAEESQRMEQTLNERLQQHLPGLSTATLRFIAFETRRKAKADEEIETKTLELEEHLELFNDRAEAGKGLILLCLNEYTEIRDKALVDMENLATIQVSVWERLLSQLPPVGLTTVMTEIRHLHEQLQDGPCREIYSTLLGSIRKDKEDSDDDWEKTPLKTI